MGRALQERLKQNAVSALQSGWHAESPMAFCTVTTKATPNARPFALGGFFAATAIGVPVVVAPSAYGLLTKSDV